jgi:hypothetical protein
VFPDTRSPPSPLDPPLPQAASVRSAAPDAGAGEDRPHSAPPKNPQVELPLDLPNLATVMKTAVFNPVYKGKFHCVKAAAGGENWVPQDVGQYG